jgi:hypothetical protein
VTFHDYSRARDFIGGFVAYTLSQAIAKHTFNDFGDPASLSSTLLMENHKYNNALRHFLPGTEESIRAAFYMNVTSHITESVVPDMSPKDTIQRYTDCLEYLSDPLVTFFDGLVTRVSGRFSRYEDKLVFVSSELVTPGTLIVGYKTVMRTPSLVIEYT